MWYVEFLFIRQSNISIRPVDARIRLVDIKLSLSLSWDYNIIGLELSLLVIRFGEIGFLVLFNIDYKLLFLVVTLILTC